MRLRPGPRMTDGAITRLAAAFWDEAGGPPRFPRDPEPLIALTLPVSVLPLADLRVATVAAWARANDLPGVEPVPDRPLRGCVLAHAGRAFILVDPADPPVERRLTVAHELGHVLVELVEPRRRAAASLGPESRDVLDGARPPHFAERVRALLADVSLDLHVHLMTRAEDGSIACARIATAECAADRFALELLAPAASLRADVLALTGRPLHQRRTHVTDDLVQRYGLPPAVAAAYARDLVHALTGGETVRAWLGLTSGYLDHA